MRCIRSDYAGPDGEKLAPCMPGALKNFLTLKYGIVPAG